MKIVYISSALINAFRSKFCCVFLSQNIFQVNREAEKIHKSLRKMKKKNI